MFNYTFNKFQRVEIMRRQELKKVLTYRVATLPDYRRVALQTFRIAVGLLSYFKTFQVALLPRYPGFCDSEALKTFKSLKSLLYLA